jgi:hypothetical protein
MRLTEDAERQDHQTATDADGTSRQPPAADPADSAQHTLKASHCAATGRPVALNSG